MISRRSSGSMLAESAVESTRSENISVTCRRGGIAWRPIDYVKTLGGRCRFGVCVEAQSSYSVEQLTTVPNNTNTQIFCAAWAAGAALAALSLRPAEAMPAAVRYCWL